MTRAKRFEAEFAVCLGRDEVLHWREYKQWRHWTGYRRRHWPSNIIRPGLKLYGFDKRPEARTLCVLLQIDRGGSFAYTSRQDFARKVSKLLGWRDVSEHDHYRRIPTGTKSKPCVGLAVSWRALKVVDIPLPGIRFPQIGWMKIGRADCSRLLELDSADLYEEGRRVLREHLVVERNPALRAASKSYWRQRLGDRLRCQICQFDFYEVYGELGDGFIEMHHLAQLSAHTAIEKLDVRALLPVCANCHRMIHRNPKEAHALAKLRRCFAAGR